jgi:hypothetical protein
VPSFGFEEMMGSSTQGDSGPAISGAASSASATGGASIAAAKRSRKHAVRVNATLQESPSDFASDPDLLCHSIDGSCVYGAGLKSQDTRNDRGSSFIEICRNPTI